MRTILYLIALFSTSFFVNEIMEKKGYGFIKRILVGIFIVYPILTLIFSKG